MTRQEDQFDCFDRIGYRSMPVTPRILEQANRTREQVSCCFSLCLGDSGIRQGTMSLVKSPSHQPHAYVLRGQIGRLTNSKLNLAKCLKDGCVVSTTYQKVINPTSKRLMKDLRL